MESLDKHVDTVLMQGEHESREEFVEARQQPREPESEERYEVSKGGYERVDDEPKQHQDRTEPQRQDYSPQQQVQRPNIPDPNEDPMGYLDGVARHFANENQQLRATQDMLTIGNSVSSQAQEFAKDHPDYHAALEFFLDQERAAWRHSGVPEAEIEIGLANTIGIQAMAIAQRGKNPAQVVYELAKQRGFNVGHAFDAVPDNEMDALWKRLDAEARGNGYIPGKRYSR